MNRKAQVAPASACCERLLADESPLVDEAQHVVLFANLGRERLERCGEAQDSQRGLVEELLLRGAHDHDLAQAAVCTYCNFEHRIAGHARATRRVREIERAELLDAQLPGRQIAREQRLLRIDGHRALARTVDMLSLIHISEPTRLLSI